MWQFVDALCHSAARGDEMSDETFVHVESAFILGPVSQVVALRQDSPYPRAEAERIGQNLEHDVPPQRTKPLIPVPVENSKRLVPVALRRWGQ